MQVAIFCVNNRCTPVVLLEFCFYWNENLIESSQQDQATYSARLIGGSAEVLVIFLAFYMCTDMKEVTCEAQNAQWAADGSGN